MDPHTPTSAVLRACPEAFAAVDLDLNVIEWNPAAESLTGFTREQALGGPLPHLTPSQLVELRDSLDTFEEWARDVPVVLPRRHADGHIFQVTVSGYDALHDATGDKVGYCSFFRAARETDPRTHARNVYSQMMSAAVRTQDVAESLRLAASELLLTDKAMILAPGPAGDGVLRPVVASGLPIERMEAFVEEFGRQVAHALGDEEAVEFGPIQFGGPDVRVVLVRCGTAPDHDVFVLLNPGITASDADAVELATTIGSEASAACAKVDAVAELEGKVEILQAIAGVAQATDLPYDRMVNHIARHAAAALSCERAAVYVWDADGERLTLEAFHSSDRQWAPGDEIHAAGRQAAGEILAKVEPFLAQDARTCPWLSGPWDHEEGSVSVYGMPLRVADHEVGVLVVAHTLANPRGFTSLCTQVGAALSQQASLAIANARFRASQVEVNRALHEVNRRRADYVEGITHDLRTPITAILGFAKTLQRAGDRLRPEDRAEALETIERQAVRVSRMLDDMMDSARAAAGELRPDQMVAVPLHHIVSEALLIATPEQRARLSASCDPSVTAVGDTDQLTRVVQNLISNALRYAVGHSPVEVQVDQVDDQAQLRVIDHGPGIPPGVDVFARFARGDARGTGLGLYTVKTIVEAHMGTILLHPTPGGGTTVDVRLPLFTP